MANIQKRTRRSFHENVRNFIFRKKLYFPLSAIIALIIFLPNHDANSKPAANAKPVNHNILILHSYNQRYEWTNEIHKGIMENLMNIENSTIFTEYLDAQQNQSKNYFDLMEKVYFNKYKTKNIQFSLIIASDDNALQFLRLKRELFRKELIKGNSLEDVPIVFCGINNFAPENFEGLTSYTGINEYISVNETVNIALKLRPNAKKMAVISGCTVIAQRNLSIFQQSIAEFQSSIKSAEDESEIQKVAQTPEAYSNNVINRLKQLKIDYMNKLEPEEIKTKLKTYSRDDIIIYLSFLSTPSGKTYTVKESVDFIRSSSDAAIFGFWDFLLPFGAIGGKVAHGYSQGAEAAKLADQILNGTPVSQIPVQMKSPNKFVFNYAVLHKYNIPLQRLPLNSIIMNKTAAEFIASWNTISKKSFFGYEMFEKHGNMMWLLDPVTGIIVDANQSAIDHYGYPCLAGMKISDINILPQEEVLANIKKARETKQNFFSLKHQLADRRVIDVEIHSYPVKIADTTLMFTIIHDVTARFKAEHAVRQRDIIIFSTIGSAFLLQSCLMFYLLKSIKRRKKVENNLKKSNEELSESEEKYRSMMESMDDAAFICSSEHVIEYMNPSMSKRVGHNSIGEVCYKAIYGLDKKCSWCLSEEVLTGGESMRTEFVNPNNKRIYSVARSPIFHIDNTVSVLSVLRDITDIKTIEAQLQQAQKMEAIGVLAGGIAHDFNNMLFPIIAYTEMLSYDIPKESPLRSSLDQIYAASMRAKEMVKQILTFASQKKSEIRRMKMQHIVKEALKLIRSTIPATIDIKQDIRKECGIINADPTQIHQIVMNLTTNAYHAMEETGGTMTVSLKEVELNEQDIVGQNIQKGIYACLTVSDTGTGIPENIKDKIFDPFFTTKKNGKGTGLGLSSIHGIVKSCCGTISLHSEIGKGTEFNIYLPVAEGYLRKEDVLQSKILIQGGHERILLVDDEALLITAQKDILERLGYQVTSCSSSIEAVEAFHANPDKFDLVITDMAMPHMSGDSLALELIKIRPDIPILLCTGFSTLISAEKALFMGIKGFLMKPVTLSEFDKKIRYILDITK